MGATELDLQPTDFYMQDWRALSSMSNRFNDAAANIDAAPVEPGFSASTSFQAAANFQPSLAPEPAPEDIHIEADTDARFGEDLLCRAENATYALANIQLSGGSWLTDTMNVALTAMQNTPSVQQTIQPGPVIEASLEPQTQYTQQLKMNPLSM
ncbi:MAG: hypothetical protein CUN55_16225 [Phototrophicales bacterium]|nr:MAG: hypothetical protein CUN55_16225 [Phototrophicales bacterium]